MPKLRRVLALLATVMSLSLVVAAQAMAAGGVDPGDGGGGDEGGTTATRVLTVDPPAQGKITGTGIDCGVGSTGDCTQSFTYPCTETACSPTVVTLTASGGRSGFVSSWSSDCVASGLTCNVTMSAARTVSLTWFDNTDPTVTLNPVPAKSGSSISVSATAGDNDGVKRVDFYVYGFLAGSDSSAPYAVSISTQSYGHNTAPTITARSVDNSDRLSTISPGQGALIDKMATVGLGSSPAAGAYLQSASLAFTIDPDMAAQCRAIRSGDPAPAFGPCISPFAPTLADGAYTFEVRGTDDVGNTATATRSFTLDTTNPTLAFTDGPPEGSIVGTSTVTFSFSSADSSPLTVECSLDSGAYAPCTSATSHTLSGMSAASHTLDVRARDAAGHQRTVRRNFVVAPPAGPGGATNGTNGTDGAAGAAGANGTPAGSNQAAADTTAPEVKLTAAARQKLKSKAIALSLNSNEGGIAGAKAMLGRSSLGTLSKTVTAGTTKLRLKLSKKAQKALAKALKRKKSVSIKLTVTVRDLAGNARVVSKTIKLSR